MSPISSTDSDWHKIDIAGRAGWLPLSETPAMAINGAFQLSCRPAASGNVSAFSYRSDVFFHSPAKVTSIDAGLCCAEGDAFLLAFWEPADAVVWAICFQQVWPLRESRPQTCRSTCKLLVLKRPAFNRSGHSGSPDPRHAVAQACC